MSRRCRTTLLDSRCVLIHVHERDGEGSAREGEVEAIDEDSDVASGSLTKPLKGLNNETRWDIMSGAQQMRDRRCYWIIFSRSKYLFWSKKAEAAVPLIVLGRVHEPQLGTSETETP